MKLAVVCCLHGTEPYGLEVIKRLPVSIPSFIGNERALQEKKRFLESDLNRCFPGNKDGNQEEKLAHSLAKTLSNFDYVIDLHSSSNSCPLFGIITNPNEEKIELAKQLGLKRLVIMPESIASGKALIDFVKCGISLEIGPHHKVENVKEVSDSIFNLIKDKNHSKELEIYEVFGIIKNFEEIKKGQVIALDSTEEQKAEENFTAILVNEQAYSGILCLAARSPAIFINPASYKKS